VTRALSFRPRWRVPSFYSLLLLACRRIHDRRYSSRLSPTQQIGEELASPAPRFLAPHLMHLQKRTCCFSHTITKGELPCHLFSLFSPGIPFATTCQVKVSAEKDTDRLIFFPPDNSFSPWIFCGIFLVVTGTGARGGLFGAGGRFKGGTDPIMEKFNESISFDKRYV